MAFADLVLGPLMPAPASGRVAVQMPEPRAEEEWVVFGWTGLFLVAGLERRLLELVVGLGFQQMPALAS